MVKFLKILINSFLLIAAIGLVSASELPASYQTCIACHGQNGEGNTSLSAPALAGIDARYLSRQLKYFKKGLRGKSAKDAYGQQMLAIAAALKEEDIADLSAALSKLPGVKSASTFGDAEKGKKYFMSNCSSCHGGKAQGNPAFKAPSLTFQDEAYLLRQLMNFRNNIRGTEKADVLGRQMAMMAKILPSDESAKDVVAYIKSL